MRFVPVVLLCTLSACSVLEQSIQDQFPMFSPKGGDIRNPGPTVHSPPPSDPASQIANGASASGLLNSNNNNPNPAAPQNVLGGSNNNSNQPASAPTSTLGGSQPSNGPVASESMLGGTVGNGGGSRGASASAIHTTATQSTQTAEIVVSRRGREGRFELVTFLQSDTWHFQRRVDNRDGTDSWFFVRRKHNDQGIEDILFRRRRIDPRGDPQDTTRSPR